MDSRCCNKRSPSQMHIVFLYALISISLDSFCLHQSSTSTPHIIYPSFEQHDYFAKSLAQRSSTMTSLVVQTANKKKKNSYQKNLLLCSFILPLILPSTVNYANLSSMQQLPPPSIAWCKFVLHNTQTNKISYMLTNFLEIVIIVATE